ncbi:UNVERIFIED_CONTAM: hypothetical protein NCL1_14651 [Trichonephila clavipes]
MINKNELPLNVVILSYTMYTGIKKFWTEFYLVKPLDNFFGLVDDVVIQFSQFLLVLPEKFQGFLGHVLSDHFGVIDEL